MYTTMVPMLHQAMQEGRGVPAFNIHALEVVPIMARTADQMGSPVILQVSVSTGRYIGFALLSALVRHLAQEAAVDIALHLDHASSLSDIRDALAGGFSSVMYDGSPLPLADNIRNTRQAVRMARDAGASIEAELGVVGRGEMAQAIAYTDPEDAARFVEATGVDALAVSIGTHHGQYRAKTQINLDVLRSIHQRVQLPLVLHGGTGVSDEDLRRCMGLGMCKLNFGTQLNVAWVRKAKEVFQDARLDDTMRNMMIACNEALADTLRNKIKLIRTQGAQAPGE